MWIVTLTARTKPIASVTSARGSDVLEVRNNRSGRRVTVEVSTGRCVADGFNSTRT